MTKSELINRLAERYSQLVAKDAEFAVKTILDAMTNALASGQRIEIRGFGSFALNSRPPRIGRNPKSGDKVMVPEKRVPHFKPSGWMRWSGSRSSKTDSSATDSRTASARAPFFLISINSGSEHRFGVRAQVRTMDGGTFSSGPPGRNAILNAKFTSAERKLASKIMRQKAL
jgi:integration host factor subunit beta